jgi:hypothetical protein
MLQILTTLKRKEIEMEKSLSYISLVITLLNLGLVFIVLNRINGLRKDLRTPVVKKFNPTDLSKPNRKPVDIQKDSDKKDFRQQNRNQQASAQGRPKNSQQSRPTRRPAVKAPDVFSNDMQTQNASAPAAATIPPRPVSAESAAEGRRPLPPRFVAQETPIGGTAPADLAPLAPAPLAIVNENNDEGVEIDRSKMTHGRRNMVKKTIIEDDDGAEEKSA